MAILFFYIIYFSMTAFGQPYGGNLRQTEKEFIQVILRDKTHCKNYYVHFSDANHPDSFYLVKNTEVGR